MRAITKIIGILISVMLLPFVNVATAEATQTTTKCGVSSEWVPIMNETSKYVRTRAWMAPTEEGYLVAVKVFDRRHLKKKIRIQIGQFDQSYTIAKGKNKACSVIELNGPYDDIIDVWVVGKIRGHRSVGGILIPA